jgi:hypothetical protein
MSSRKLVQWRPLSDIDRRLIVRLGAAEFKGEELSDNHFKLAQRILCAKGGPLSDRLVGSQTEIDISALVG